MLVGMPPFYHTNVRVGYEKAHTHTHARTHTHTHTHTRARARMIVGMSPFHHTKKKNHALPPHQRRAPADGGPLFYSSTFFSSALHLHALLRPHARAAAADGGAARVPRRGVGGGARPHLGPAPSRPPRPHRRRRPRRRARLGKRLGAFARRGEGRGVENLEGHGVPGHGVTGRWRLRCGSMRP